MIIAAAILAFLILICFLRVRLLAQYDENGFIMCAYVGPIVKRILPADKARQRKEKRKKARESAIKAGRLESLRAQLPSLKQALTRLKRKLLIKELTIHYMAAGADPAATAINFGAVNTVYGMILPLIENNFNIRNRDLRASVNFESDEPYIYVKAILSLAVWEAVYVAFGVVKNMIKSENMRAKIRKAG